MSTPTDPYRGDRRPEDDGFLDPIEDTTAAHDDDSTQTWDLNELQGQLDELNAHDDADHAADPFDSDAPVDSDHEGVAPAGSTSVDGADATQTWRSDDMPAEPQPSEDATVVAPVPAGATDSSRVSPDSEEAWEMAGEPDFPRRDDVRDREAFYEDEPTQLSQEAVPDEVREDVAPTVVTTPDGRPTGATTASDFAPPPPYGEQATLTSTPDRAADQREFPTDDQDAAIPAVPPATGYDRDAQPWDVATAEEAPAAPAGRAGRHVLSFFVTLLLAPFAWYLMTDAGFRYTQMSDSAWPAENSSFDFAVLGEMVGGMVLLAIIFIVAAYSSLGAMFWGAIIFIVGLFTWVAPSFAKDIMGSDAVANFADFNTFTSNVVFHLGRDWPFGIIAVFGLVLFLLGLATHLARRDGAVRGNILGKRSVLVR